MLGGSGDGVAIPASRRVRRLTENADQPPALRGEKRQDSFKSRSRIVVEHPVGVESDIQGHDRSRRVKLSLWRCLTESIQRYRFFLLNGNQRAPASYPLELSRSCDDACATGAGKGAGLVPSPGQLSIVVEVGRVDPEVTRRYQYRTMRLIARMGPAVDRM